MERIEFNFADEKKAAQAGGGLITGNSSTYKGQTITMALTAPWYKKDSNGDPTTETRTKSGALGITTTHGWLNGSELLTFMEGLSGQDVFTKLIETKTVSNKKKYSLIIDPTFNFKMSIDNKGKIAKVES